MLPEDINQKVDRIQFMNNDTNELVKTLGICWKIKDDTSAIETNFKENPFTHRGILSAIGSVYDPLGIVAPFVTKGKIILQSLCRYKLDWDQSIDKEHRND